jgi:hypothetical protein
MNVNTRAVYRTANNTFGNMFSPNWKTLGHIPISERASAL